MRFGLGTLETKNSGSGFPHSSHVDSSIGFSCLQYLQNLVVGMTSTAFLPQRPQKEQNDPQVLITRPFPNKDNPHHSRVVTSLPKNECSWRAPSGVSSSHSHVAHDVIACFGSHWRMAMRLRKQAHRQAKLCKSHRPGMSVMHQMPPWSYGIITNPLPPASASIFAHSSAVP